MTVSSQGLHNVFVFMNAALYSSEFQTALANPALVEEAVLFLVASRGLNLQFAEGDQLSTFVDLCVQAAELRTEDLRSTWSAMAEILGVLTGQGAAAIT